MSATWAVVDAVKLTGGRRPLAPGTETEYVPVVEDNKTLSEVIDLDKTLSAVGLIPVPVRRIWLMVMENWVPRDGVGRAALNLAAVV